MAFHQIQATSAHKAPTRNVIAEEISPLWGILRDVRSARDQLGLKDRAITVLQAMISLLPKDNSRTRVFASNKTLTDRANGIGDRTLRRHIAVLVDLGLIQRHDSANRKRFARKDPDTGELIGYGFDLAPLLHRAEELGELAAETAREAARISILRNRLSTLRHLLLESGQGVDQAEAIKKALRRKMSAADLDRLITGIEQEFDTQPPSPAADLSANDSQIDRHIQRSNTKEFDIEEQELNPEATRQEVRGGYTKKETPSSSHKAKVDPGQKATDLKVISLNDVKVACPEIFCFAPAPVNRWRDMHCLGRSVGRMAGIAEELLDLAEQRLGASGLAITVAVMMQMGSRIRSHGAYLRALVSGKNANTFDPVALISRMSRATS